MPSPDDVVNYECAIFLNMNYNIIVIMSSVQCCHAQVFVLWTVVM